MEDRVLPKREEVLQYLTALWRPVREVEKVSLNRAFGRILSEDVYSQVTLPVVRASMCDGIAVKSSMFAEGYPDADSMEPGADFERADTFDMFIQAHVTEDGRGGYLAEPAAGKGASVAENFSANGYFYLNAGAGALKAGQEVEISLFGNRSYIPSYLGKRT
ncbi:MAG TPA: hypothetical protein IAA08_12060 [Candidatus Eubacterium avistercoris]|uniref:Molybdopterin molybdenumtransferase n=1 Tax=Candidatus Eubacterium avistercoris TaxID=2838567 RepID=A0A9D2D540_9FIRM|nr:hypothetical protein [Candidatus Eubacterium avistercoris]